MVGSGVSDFARPTERAQQRWPPGRAVEREPQHGARIVGVGVSEG
jgi:hypothetical protein